VNLYFPNKGFFSYGTRGSGQVRIKLEKGRLRVFAFVDMEDDAQEPVIQKPNEIRRTKQILLGNEKKPFFKDYYELVRESQITKLISLKVDDRLKLITKQALDLFEDSEETQRWLSTPKVALGGQTPLKALMTDSGLKKVEELLYQAEYGIFG
jgi:hypothetical protein